MWLVERLCGSDRLAREAWNAGCGGSGSQGDVGWLGLGSRP